MEYLLTVLRNVAGDAQALATALAESQAREKALAEKVSFLESMLTPKQRQKAAEWDQR